MEKFKELSINNSVPGRYYISKYKDDDPMYLFRANGTKDDIKYIDILKNNYGYKSKFKNWGFTSYNYFYIERGLNYKCKEASKEELQSIIDNGFVDIEIGEFQQDVDYDIF